MTWPGLPVLVKLAGRPVILLGDGEAADAKRRLLERAGATVADDPEARLAIVAIEDDAQAEAAVARLRARGVLVNAVDRPALCDFTLPAIVDRAPVLVAVMTGGVSAGLAAALRQGLEAILSSSLGDLALRLQAARLQLRARYPDKHDRRRAIAEALAPGGAIDPLGPDPDIDCWIADWDETPQPTLAPDQSFLIYLSSRDPDDLTLRQARILANADRVFHAPDAPAAILDRARADAPRIACDAPPDDEASGLSVWVGWG